MRFYPTEGVYGRAADLARPPPAPVRPAPSGKWALTAVSLLLITSSTGAFGRFAGA